MEWKNQNSTPSFILIGLSNHPQLQILLFFIFFVIYVISLLGNILIVTIIIIDTRLHLPMYFFLINLSALDIWCTSVAVPKMLTNIIMKRKDISFAGCVVQLCFFTSALGTELLLLTVMGFDRYIAICYPFHYTIIMNKKLCLLLAAAVWIIGLVNSLVHTGLIFRLHFCGDNILDHFFCEVPSVLRLSCTDTRLNDLVMTAADSFFGISCFLLTLVSYTYIISAVIKIRSAEGKRKAFSTCASHLTVVGLYYATVIYTYLRPAFSYAMADDKIVSALYTILSPVLNPIVYSLRTKEVKEAFMKIVGKKIFPQRI
ncbi:olfactory receptor 13G1-like [Microcaecilia unicolor]|uniref:Olfactory receptor n=1 Tax=Microcaecilia unicolor TaxID=1415580 RepID=A0A6P7X2P4_9AMPH|nr:olfactory receptor 13G1-like [Microcaecilia unicolor]XP_030046723.1 olfactory receptor 13G1-like [Microcaecilia unicolor]